MNGNANHSVFLELLLGREDNKYFQQFKHDIKEYYNFENLDAEEWVDLVSFSAIVATEYPQLVNRFKELLEFYYGPHKQTDFLLDMREKKLQELREQCDILSQPNQSPSLDQDLANTESTTLKNL